MMKKFVLVLFIQLLAIGIYAQTSLSGKVKDKESGEDLITASVSVEKNGVFITGTVTDIDGNFSVNLDPGTYTVIVKMLGYGDQQINNVIVKAGKANPIEVLLSSDTKTLGVIEIVEQKVPLIEQDNTTQGSTLTSEQIQNLPVKSIIGIVAASAGTSSVDGGDASIRGSRTDGTVFYLDGIRYTGRNIPTSEIEQLQVITGGIEAQYGDVTGGIVSSTTKGPSSKISGGLEAETSQYLDPYGYNLISGNLSGPIWKKTIASKNLTRTILGYRLAGQYNYQKDDDPPAYGVYRAKEATINRLISDPTYIFHGSKTTNGLFLKEGEDVEKIKYNPNEENKALDFSAKLDFRPTEQIDFSITGIFADVKNRFTPDVNTESDGIGTTVGNGSWTLLNWTRNPYRNTQTYRGLVRFRHRLGRTNTGTEEGKKPSSLQNAYYTLQAGYENIRQSEEDLIHKDNFFNYGYVGSFDRQWDPVFDFQSGDHVGFVPLVRGFTPSNINPALSNYNKLLPAVEDQGVLEAYTAFNGAVSNSNNTIWSGIHTQVGSVYNNYVKSDDEILTLQLTSGFDFLPKGRSNTRHNLQFGGLVEQRIDRGYTLRPFELWKIGRLYTNNHIVGVDTSLIDYYDTTGRPIYKGLITESPDSRFNKSVRRVLYPNANQDSLLRKYVNLDGLTPDQLSLDMFSSRELTDQSLVGYRGYDYLGNKLSRNVKFDDFFKVNADGTRDYKVAANAPVYAAGYVQDKFSYKDIIFRAGIRVDYYDANTKVIKDQYSLYDILGAKVFHAKEGTVKPGTIGDDFKVYLSKEGSSDVKAYRDGDQWYFPNGAKANSSSLIYGENNNVTPAYFQPADSLRTIRGSYFKPENSFEDYTPQINLMPRLAFSFPISDDANFFAHYDILVQRPTSNSFVSPLDYFYWDISGRTPADNGRLKPSKTVDYEVGFQQKITNSSAIKLSAYYKELRDMIQRTTLSKVAGVGTYDTYGNLDFGTVKGFNFSYDLRRVVNFSFNAAYTLQFADGTGSDPNSQRGLTGKGINIRNIFPFNFDERHRFAFTFDYRYDEGKKYNGPRLFGKNIFANAGINLQLITASGRPYSPGTTITRFGGEGYLGAINGARYPWNYNIDIRADKNFSLTKEGSKNPLSLNIYLRVQNLLDTRNVIGVYRGSKSAADDGYLANTRGVNEIKSVSNIYGQDQVQYFVDSYNWRLLNPDNYTLPRRIFVGAIFNF